MRKSTVRARQRGDGIAQGLPGLMRQGSVSYYTANASAAWNEPWGKHELRRSEPHPGRAGPLPHAHPLDDARARLDVPVLPGAARVAARLPAQARRHALAPELRVGGTARWGRD